MRFVFLRFRGARRRLQAGVGWPVRAAALLLAGVLPSALHASTTLPAPDLSARLQACTVCHGDQGRAGPDGFYPRLAGKPAGYLYHQLLNFRDGRRHYGLMVSLIDRLDDRYLMEIARHFEAMQVPYPAPAVIPLSAQQRARAETLVRSGDRMLGLPACTACHGPAMMGAAPDVPGLLGLPQDYLNAQLGAWRSGARRAHAPDCMAEVARRLQPHDIAALTGWLASQPVPAGTGPVAASGLPASGMSCGRAQPRRPLPGERP